MLDIIIPIYNGYEDLEKCLASVKKYTDLTKNRVVLINDKSPDERILPFIQAWAKENTGTVLIDNEENKGFSGNVNLGFDISDNDVILLNTDTIVTREWAEKMQRCAYSDPSVATVTPLSNNATLASVPKFCDDNKLPEGFTVDRMGDLVEQCSMHQYPEVTVAVGFCMYIRREVIRRVGYFDAETFGRGYGEENDFCNRAGQLGYRHVLCDDTYVYHSGTVSFQDTEKLELLKAHDKILEKRYPLQMYANMRFVTKNPIHKIQENVQLHMAMELLQNGKKNLLMVSHLDFREDAQEHIGGVQLHLKDLVGALKSEFNIFVAARDGEDLNLTIYFGKERLSFKYFIGDAAPFARMHDPRIETAFTQILDSFAFDLIHIHQVYQLSFDIFKLAKQRAIPFYVTLHDYYYICPNIKLLDTTDHICTGRETPQECETCLWERSRLKQNYGYLLQWRQDCEKYLSAAVKLIAPSQKAQEVYQHYYPQLKDAILVIPHGYDMPSRRNLPMDWSYEVSPQAVGVFDVIEQVVGCELQLSGWAYIENADSATTEIGVEVSNGKSSTVYPAEVVKRGDIGARDAKYLYSGFLVRIPPCAMRDGDNWFRIVLRNKEQTLGVEKCQGMHYTSQFRKNSLKVGFIGGFSAPKGSKQMLELFKHRPENCDFVVMGAIGDKKLKKFEMDGLVKTGPYDREKLADYLAEYEVDVICIFSTWDETFCYTLSEALACGVPVMVTDTGAPAERLEQNGCGWILPCESVAENAAKLLNQLALQPEMLEAKRRQIDNIHLKSVLEMADEYAVQYHEDALSNPQTLCLTPRIREAYFYAHEPKRVDEKITQEIENAQEQLRIVQRQLDAIHRAKSYRMLVRINQLRKTLFS